MLKRRLCRRGLCLILIASMSLYACVLLLGDLRTPMLAQLTELHRCPACYGVSICPALYSNKIKVSSHIFRHIFNAKNVFYGVTDTNKKVVLKKLGQDWELKEVDRKLCAMINKSDGCRASELLNITNMDERMAQLVRVDASSRLKARSGLLLCPYTHGLPQLLRPLLGTGVTPPTPGAMLNALTLLLLNPEPILLQTLDSQSWPVPTWGGACGRLAVVADAGEPLSNRVHASWYSRLGYAQQILKAAMDFTFKHDRFRFYLMDWSLDNIVVDQERIAFCDLEDVIVLDKHAIPGPELKDWYMRYNRGDYGPGFVFSVERMCSHHLSDHNVWAACYVLAGGDRPLLLPLPPAEAARSPYLEVLLMECLHGSDKFSAVTKLQQVVSDILHRYNSR